MPTGASFQEFEKELNRLVEVFGRNLSHYKTPGYDEASLQPRVAESVRLHWVMRFVFPQAQRDCITRRLFRQPLRGKQMKKANRPANRKGRKVGRVAPRTPRIGYELHPASKPPAVTRVSASVLPTSPGARGATRPTTLHRELRAWRASLPTPRERDTLLMPNAIAESVVQESERLLGAELPADYAARLAVRAHHLYPRHKHFQKMLKRPGNRSRDRREL